MSYEILRTDQAEDQLRNLIFYIAEESGDISAALHYLEQIETAMNRLREYPLSGSLPRYKILKKQGYRVLIIERHLVFYKVFEADRSVIIYAIVDGRREYVNLL